MGLCYCCCCCWVLSSHDPPHLVYLQQTMSVNWEHYIKSGNTQRRAMKQTRIYDSAPENGVEDEGDGGTFWKTHLANYRFSSGEFLLPLSLSFLARAMGLPHRGECWGYRQSDFTSTAITLVPSSSSTLVSPSSPLHRLIFRSRTMMLYFSLSQCVSALSNLDFIQEITVFRETRRTGGRVTWQ